MCCWQSRSNMSGQNNIHPACELCRGACCRGLLIDADVPTFVRDLDWWKYHGTQTALGTMLHCQCSKLGTDGKCTVYETRPDTCRTFTVGCRECRVSIRTFRPEQAEAIETLLGDCGEA